MTAVYATIIQLNSLSPYTYTYPTAISNSGIVVGNASEYLYGTGSLNTNMHAVEWINGSVNAIPELPGYSVGSAIAVDNAGDVVAFSANTSSGYVSLYRYSNGTETQLSPGLLNIQWAEFDSSGNIYFGALPNNVYQDEEYTNGSYHSISSLPSVSPVGQSGGDVTTKLPSLNGQITRGWAENDAGLIVGFSGPTGYISQSRAIVYQNGTVTDLNTYLPANSGWVLEYALAVNDRDQIVGFGTYNGTYASFELTLPLPTYTASGAMAAFQANPSLLSISDSAANIQSNLDNLETIAAATDIGTITLTDNGTPTLIVTAAELSTDSAVLQDISGSFTVTVTGVSAKAAGSEATQEFVHSVSVSDSAANISAAIDTLASLASAGKLTSVAITDSGIPSLSLSANQLSSDISALQKISGPFSLSVSAPTLSETLTGATNALGNTLTFTESTGQYTITATGDGVHFTVSESGVTDTLSNIQALKFADLTLIVAQTPGSTTVTTGNVTELYAAVFGREPDVPGLAYYQQELAANPSRSLISLAETFLASPEYANNSAHAYAQTPVGEAAFINDSYSNLLHRAPEAGAVAWYQANIIEPILSGLTAGTQAYSDAELHAHAQVLADFSQSSEFLGNVQATTQHPASAQHWLILI